MATICGTGDWTGPKPGDPDNNSTLSASPAFGGIDVSWTYPSVNPHAVAHVLLYRGISDNYAASVKQATVSGNTFYDRITGTAGTRYYYWIQIVSVNGTVGNVIGPASAIARTRAEDTLTDLTGKIDQGALAISLKTEIDKISLNYQAIIDEANSRIASNSALSQALDILNGRANAVETFVINEITQRKNGDDALVTQFNLLAAANKNNSALIAEERTVRVTAVDALSQVQTALNSQVNHPITGLPATRGTLLTDYYTKVKTDEAIAAANLTLNSTVFNATTGLPATRSLLINDYYTKAGTNSAISTATLGLVSQTGLNNTLSGYTNTASLQNLYSTKTDTATAITTATSNLASKSTFASYTTTADLQISYYTKTEANSAISSSISNIQVTGPSGGLVGLQQAMTAQYSLNNKYNALYTIKLTNNGLIGGFGLANDGATVDAGFDVDKFWVGRTSAQSLEKPFFIEGGTVYIEKAKIKSLSLDRSKLANGSIAEGYYLEGTSSVSLSFTVYVEPGNTAFVTILEYSNRYSVHQGTGKDDPTFAYRTESDSTGIGSSKITSTTSFYATSADWGWEAVGGKRSLAAIIIHKTA